MHIRMVRALAPAAALAVLMTGATMACAQMPSPTDEEVNRAATSITAQNLESHLGVIAHDSMRGRETPSPELMQTALYIAELFESYGLEAGAGEGYLQLYSLTRIQPAAADRQLLRLVGPQGVHDLHFDADFFVQASSGTATAKGPLRLIQSADEMPTGGGDVAVLRVTTSNIRQVFGGRLRGAIRAADPAGLIVVLDISTNRFNRFREFLGSERMVYGEVEEEGVPVLFVAQSSLPAPLAEAVAQGSLPEGWSAELSTAAEVTVEQAPNTIGLLRGSDPELRDEYVLFTAHMDHVGVGRPVAGDSIYNGADDDGSGTVTVVELARAFSELEVAPRRSMIFLLVSGEEKGLLGSRYYSANPTFPLDQTVANLNLDMVGRNWPDTIVVIGKEESSLGPQIERIAATRPELNMAVIDDLWPEESFYTRSDHYSFAQKGVPILFFFNGTHEDYHQPSDEAEAIGYDKMARIGRLLFYLGLEVANQDDRPEWDPEAYDRVVDRPRT